MDRTSEEMYGHKWWLCWKISVQCGRELNFLHSDITVIISHVQILILYNWRPYLSITPCSIEALSCNYCCNGKAVSIAQPECICSLRYPARNVHAPYCHLWHIPLYTIFPYYLINDTIFEKKKIAKIKCVLVFSTTFSLFSVCHPEVFWHI